MDGRKSRYVGEVLDWYRGEDVGDLKRSELDVLVENWTCLNAHGRKIFKSDLKILMDEKSWNTWKSNQKIVMNEELVQNGVMNEKNVKNFVNAKIDPKAVMDLSISKIGGWSNLHPINQKFFEEFIDENEPWLLIGIPSTCDTVFGTTLCEFGSAHEEIDVTS